LIVMKEKNPVNTFEAIYLVWKRYVAVYRKNIRYALVTTFVEPMLYLASFGFGLGAVINDINAGGVHVSYRAFVLVGIVGQTILFQSFFEAAYGSFIRMYYQKIFQAIAVTPVTLSEVLWGELMWDASRSTISATVVLMIGVIVGDFSFAGVLIAIPICFLFGIVFSSLGLLVAAKSVTIDSISYPQYLFVMPMFLFCGVFFPLTNLPVVLQKVIFILPLTSVLSVLRSLTLGFSFEWVSVILLLVWAAILVPLSRRAMIKRLVA
jgi:lipooligosaccharide transport system permease protein